MTRRRAGRIGGLVFGGMVIPGMLVAVSAPQASADQGSGLTVTVAQRWKVTGSVSTWLPYTVTVRNDGRGTFGGDVFLVPDQAFNKGPYPPDSFPQYRASIVVPAQSERTTTINVLEANSGYRAELRDSQGKVLATAAPDGSNARASSAVAVLSDLPTAERRIAAAVKTISGLSVGLSSFASAEAFPASVSNLSGLNGVILDQFNTAALSEAQIQALRDFVGLGGSLIEVGGASWRRTLTPLPDALLPMRPAGTSTADLGAVTDLAGLTANPQAQVADGDLASWARAAIAGPSSPPLIVEGSYGMGQIVELTFDPLAPPIANDVDLAAVTWGQAISRALSGTQGAWQASFKGAGGPAPIGAPTGSGPGTWAPFPGQLYPIVRDMPIESTPPFGLLALALATYVLLITGASYLLLRAVGHRGMLWASTPILAIICTTGAYLGGFGTRGGDYVQTEVQVQRMGPSGVVEIVAFQGVQSPRKGDVAVDLAPNTSASTALATYGGPSAAASQALVTEGARPKVLLPNVAVWDLRTLQTHSFIHAPSTAGGSAEPLDVRLRAGHGRILGTITNHTSQTFRNLQLVSREGGRAALAATLAPGSSLTIDAALSPGTVLPSKGATIYGPEPVDVPQSSKEALVSVAASQVARNPGSLALVGESDPATTLRLHDGHASRTTRVLLAVPVKLLSADSVASAPPAPRLVSSFARPDSSVLDCYELDLPPGLSGRVGLSYTVAPQNQTTSVRSVEVYDWDHQVWRRVLAPSTALSPGETGHGRVMVRVHEGRLGTLFVSVGDQP